MRNKGLSVSSESRSAHLWRVQTTFDLMAYNAISVQYVKHTLLIRDIATSILHSQRRKWLLIGIYELGRWWRRVSGVIMTKISRLPRGLLFGGQSQD